MTGKDKFPMTLAIRELIKHKVEWTHHPYTYEERGGTEASSRELNVPEHAVIKTLIMETDTKMPLVVLMHGDREVSTKQLARHLGAKTVSPCKPEIADRHSGYQVGGTSPFGTKKQMPIYMEKSIASLPKIYINGGKRGYLVGLVPSEVIRVLNPTLVDIAAAQS